MLSRIWALVLLELRSAWRRPLWWVLLTVLVLLTWGLTAGNLLITTGGTSADAERAWTNSQFTLSWVDIVVFTLTYLFFAAVAFGNATNDDEDHRIGPILHSTRLTVGEYVMGRWLGVAAVACIVMGVHFVVQIGFAQLYPVEEPEKVRDPVFNLWNYAKPFLLFIALPTLSLGAFTFAVGTITRQTVLVFLTPVLVLMASIFVLWSLNPEWLPGWADTAMQVADPTGFRWLNNTWLKDDRGAAFFNRTPVPLDAVVVLNRLWPAALGALGLLLAVAAQRRRVRNAYRVEPAKAAEILAASAPDVASAPVAASAPDAAGLGALHMVHAKPSWLSTFLAQARAEAKELRRSPGLWIFVPLITLEVIGVSLYLPGAFDTLNNATTGSMLAGSFNTVTLLALFLLLYYVTESLARDHRRRMAALLDSSPAGTSARVLGKLLANLVVVLLSLLVAIAIAMFVALLIQALQAEGGPAPMPHLLPLIEVWTFLLVPTVVAWLGLIAFVWSLTRSRYAVYAVGIGVLVLTGLLYVNAWVNWVGNWHLWDGLVWTDFGSFELDRRQLVLNRVGWFLVGALLIQLAIMAERRRTPDVVGIASRVKWKPALRTVLYTLPLALPAAIALGALALDVRFGSDGGPMEHRAKEYRAANAETWRDAKNPFIATMDLDVRLDPHNSTFAVKGEYTLENPFDAPMERFALSPGLHFEDQEVTFQGKTYTVESAVEERKKQRGLLPVECSAGMWVFRPTTPLAKGERSSAKFSYHGQYPPGAGKNTRGASEFILPSGVVLNAFGVSFLPLVGWQDGPGVDPEDAAEPRRPDPSEWEKTTKAGFGSGGSAMITVRIEIPEEYRANAPGVLASDEVRDGWRTMTWRTDQPVRFFNIVAGKWNESKGERTSIWHLPEHDANVPSMLRALDGAHQWYSEWFWPYPFKELRLTEFPGLAGYAQGFGTNIVFSENIGFKSRPTAEHDAPFMIVAHEAAHQWWGNILMPGDGPGGNILSEGLAHYSTARLIEKLGYGDGTGPSDGEQARQAFMRLIEKSYVEKRVVDDERPMVEIDGARGTDGTITYDKGGWVFWMMKDLIGEKQADAGAHEFIKRFKDGPDYPLLQDYVKVMRDFAPDKAAYDAFVQQWFFDVVLPEYMVESAIIAEQADGTWRTTATVTNKGTGTANVTVAATNGKDRWPGAGVASEYADARASATVGAGETATVEIASPWKPEKVVVDPDVRVLQLGRKKAERAVSAKGAATEARPPG